MFGSSYSAAGGADALEDILKQKFIEITERQRQKQQADMLGETRRQNDMVQARFNTQRGDALSREAAAKAERAAAAAAAKAQRDAFLRQFPHLAPLVQAQDAGLNINDPHKLETPDVHGVHVADEAKRDEADGLRKLEGELKLRTRYRAPEKPEKAPTPQLVQGTDGSLRAVQFVNGQFVDVPVPAGLRKTNPQPTAKTPEELEAEAAARARGTAVGKKDAGGGGILSGIASIFSGGDKKPAGPKVGERRVINGTPAKWDGQGWVAER